MPKNRTACDRAMAISNRYKRVVELRQQIDLELKAIEAMVVADGRPLHDAVGVRDLRSAHNLSMRLEIAQQQAVWHNVAFVRGYFDIEEGPKKLSKSDQ